MGLTDNPSALTRWVVGGPKISRMIQEFQTSLGVNQGSLSVPDESHHKQRKRFQENFKSDVANLASLIQDTGNPFLERGTDFVTLHNDDIVGPVVHALLQKLHVLGVEQYEAFVRDRLTGRTKKTSEPIKRNNALMISGRRRKKKTAKSYQISSLKSDCRLYSRLYIVCQTRSRGLDDFFMYENQSAPPSLSCEGNMRSTAKSSLLEWLEPLPQPAEVLHDMDVMILDGAAIVSMLRPGTARTIGSYSADVSCHTSHAHLKMSAALILSGMSTKQIA